MGDVGVSGGVAEPGLLYVPVSVCSVNIVTIRTGRLSCGERIGLGFTSAAGLAAVFGPGQAWIVIHLRALHQMLACRGITIVQVDPVMRPFAPAPAPVRSLLPDEYAVAR
jgi:hypothetical protein